MTKGEGLPAIGPRARPERDEALPGGDVGEIADPEHVRRGHAELPVRLVLRAWGLLVGDGCLVRFASDDALNTHPLHQPGHGAAGNREAFPIQLTPDLAHAVDAPVLLEDALDLGPQDCVAPGTIRQPGRIGPPRQVIVVGGWGDRQNSADRLDPVRLTLIVPLGVCLQTPAGNG